MKWFIALLVIIFIGAMEIVACAWMLGQFGVRGDFGHRKLLSLVVVGLLNSVGRGSGSD